MFGFNSFKFFFFICWILIWDVDGTFAVEHIKTHAKAGLNSMQTEQWHWFDRDYFDPLSTLGTDLYSISQIRALSHKTVTSPFFLLIFRLKKIVKKKQKPAQFLVCRCETKEAALCVTIYLNKAPMRLEFMTIWGDLIHGNTLKKNWCNVFIWS